MHNISQIIDRNLQQRAPCETALWINPEKDHCWQQVANSCASLKLFSQDQGAFLFHQNAGANAEFGAIPCTQNSSAPGPAYAWIILNLPRHKALLRMMLDCAAGLLADDGVLWLAGENKAGIKSADRILRERFASVRKLDNARHCTLYEAKSPLNQQAFSAEDYQQKWLLNCDQQEIRVVSYPGVFAHGRLDAGTALLLENMDQLSFSGDVLDFGCGAGVIGVCIATASRDVNLTFLDNSALALKACQDTLSANQLNATVLASDGLAALTQSYDVLISNPPIHASVKTDNQLSMRLLQKAHEYIKPGGKLILVANRHLPYENWLSENFQQRREIAANGNFKVIVAEK